MGASIGLGYNKGFDRLQKCFRPGYYEGIEPSKNPWPGSNPGSWLDLYGNDGSHSYVQNYSLNTYPHWLFFANGSDGSTASGLADMMARKNYSAQDVDYLYAWWMDGGPNMAATTTKDSTLGIPMSPTMTGNIENKYGDSWEAYFKPGSSGVTSVGTPALGNPVIQGNVPGTGFAASAAQVGKTVGDVLQGASNFLGGLMGGSGQQQMPPPGPPPMAIPLDLVLGFVLIGVGIILFIVGATEPRKK